MKGIKMLSFHNDAAIKETYLSRVRAHRQADEIVKGKYWENGKGCAIGCTIHGDTHESYETELGIPQILAHLEDRIFENLPNDLAMTWPERFLEAIPVGRDLSNVWPKFAIFLLMDSSQCGARHPQCKITADKFQQQLDGQVVDWKSAATNATNAAAVATNAATNAAAYAYATTYAYAAAAAAAAAATATNAAYVMQSEKLLQLLKDT